MKKNNRRPHLIVIAGPNGSGKSTIFPALQNVETDGFPLAPVSIKDENFINPDNIAEQDSLNEFAAGKKTIEKINKLIGAEEDLAIETTLSGKTLAKHFDLAIQKGYRIYIIFLTLRSLELSMNRVTQRALLGKHYISLERIQNRYKKSLNNFFNIYKKYANIWIIVDNSSLNVKPLYWGGKDYGTKEIFCLMKENNYITKFIDLSLLSENDELMISQFYKRVEPLVVKEINNRPKGNYVVIQEETGKINFVKSNEE